MNAAIKIDITKCPVPRLAPTKAVHINIVEDKDLRRMQKHVELVRDYEWLKQHHGGGRKPSVWTKEAVDALIRMNNEGKSGREIAEALGVTKEQVFAQKSKLRAAGKIETRKETRDDGWRKEEDDKLIQLYQRGVGFTALAQQVGRTEGACLYRLKTLREKGVNIPFRGHVLDKLAPGRGDD